MVVTTLAVWVAVSAARAQAIDGVRERAQVYTRDALDRAEETADQVSAGRDEIAAAIEAGASPCSPELLTLMRSVHLRSKYVQAFGMVDNDTLRCSSAGVENLALGPAETVTGFGARIRTHVRLPEDPDTEYIVTEKDGIAAVVNPELTIDITADPAVAVAEFNTVDRTVVASRGSIERGVMAEALSRVPVTTATALPFERTFLHRGNVISVATSGDRFLGTVAVIPAADVTSAIQRTMLLLIPLGAVAGVVLGAAILQMARRRRALPSVLRSAFRRNEIFLVYQPIVQVETGRWIGAEVLARWRRPSGELVPPDVFVPIAETVGLSRALTTHVVTLLQPDLALFLERDPDFVISINLTHDDLWSDETPAMIEQLVHETGVPPEQIVLEVTERRRVDTEQCRNVIIDLRELGVVLTLDDFGTGYSNLSYLQTLDVDAVKIDKSFVETAETGAATASVMKHIVDIATSLDLRIIAEGVETESQAEMIQRYGIEQAQGWLYSRPLATDDLLDGLAAQVTSALPSAAGEADVGVR